MRDLPQPIPNLPGWRHLALADVGSTNTEALRLAADGDPGSLWVTANRQLHGKGRNGRTWISEAGNLYASLLLIDPATKTAMANLPLVAALAVYETLKPYFSKTPYALAIKWPNDILVDRQKINGILLESAGLSDGHLAVVIGCGINCVHHPDNPLYPATDLAACGVSVDTGTLFDQLSDAFAKNLSVWNRGAGFHVIRERWLMAARGIGGQVIVNHGDHSITGMFEEIDHDGYLCLKLDDGSRQKISAGDLFFD